MSALPEGFEEVVPLPEGFEEVAPVSKKKNKTSLGEDFKIGLSSLGNTVDRYGSGLGLASLSLIGRDDLGDKLYQSLQERIKSRNDFSATENEQGIAGKVASAAMTLPSQLLAFPMSPAETGQTMIDEGENLPTAMGGAAIDTLGNVAGAAIPGAQSLSLPARAAFGAATNAAQDVVTRSAIAGIAENQSTKDLLGPSVENAAVAGVIGGGLGAAGGKGRKPKEPEAEIPEGFELVKPPMPDDIRMWKERAEQLQAEAIAAEQAKGQNPLYVNSRGQALDAEALAKQESAVADRNAQLEQVKADRLHQQMAQAEDGMLPFHSSVEEIAARRADPAQADMFLDNKLPEPLEAPEAPITDYGTGVRTGYRSNAVELSKALPEPVVKVERPSIETAVEKLSQGKNFDMTAEERIVWEKTKALVEKVESGYDKLSDRQIADKIMDRQWIEDTVTKVKQMDEMFKEVEQKALNEKDRAEMQKKREALNDSLSMLEQRLRETAYKPTGDGQGPKTRAFNRRSVPASQRGALNMKALEEGFNKFKVVGDKLLQVKGMDGSSFVEAYDRAGNKIGEVRLAPKEWANPSERSDTYSMWTNVDPKYRGTGLVDEMYKYGAEVVGDIRPSHTQTAEGAKMWDRFEKQGISKNRYIPHGQRGAIILGTPEPRKGNKVSKLTKDSPEVVAAKKIVDADKRKHVVSKILNSPTLDPYKVDIDTPEKVIALAPDAKDLGPVQTAKAVTVSPGINSVAISSNNPFVKYVRDSVSKTIRETEALTREYITGPNGFGNKLKQLSQSEKNAVVGVLQWADRHQQSLSPETLKQNGFNEKQIDFIQHIQKMDEAKLEIWNKVRSELGLPLVKDREGHFAGNFSGDYRTLVYDKDKNIVGVINTNTKWGNMLVKRKVAAKHKGLTFAETKRQSLGGSGPKASVFTGFADIMNIIAKDDPRFQKIQEVIDAAIKDRGDSLYGASLHANAKKGIWGNEGNKEWLDRNENTTAALKSFVDYWENGIASHLNLPTEVKIKELMDNPALDHMPNAKKYADKYIQNYTGRSVGTLGDSINKLIDAPFRYLGLGPTVPRTAITQFNKRASQFTMGFINPLFLLTQGLQIPQMGIPELMKVGESLGKSPIDAEIALNTAIQDGLKLAIEAHTGKKQAVDEFTRDSYQYARDNGLLEFSEYANARDIFQHPASKAFDQVADSAREVAEKATRPTMFFAAVNMLKDSGMSPKEIYDAAYNITQHAMVSYHKSEKPLMYGRLGVLGNAAGSLQTFKHAYLGQLGTFIKDASKGRPGPLLAALAVMAAFSGIKGVPFYQEADELVKLITDEYFSDRKSIADLALENFPEWSKSGALSTLSGVNMQSRLSAADVLPSADKPLEAISPFASWAGKIGQGAVDVVKNNDKLAWSNLATAVAPSGTIKGMVENALKTDESGNTINRTGEVDYHRTDEDKAIRKWTGGSSLDESLNKSKTYEDSINQKSRQDAQKSITKQGQRILAQNKLSQEEIQAILQGGEPTPKLLAVRAQLEPLVEKYIKEKGDPQQFVDALAQYATTMNMTTKQRLQGTPTDNISSVNRYKNYND